MDRTSDLRCTRIYCNMLWMLFLLVINMDVVMTQRAPGTPSISGPSPPFQELSFVDLTCNSVGGDPDPTLYWYKNEQIVDSTYTASGSGASRVTTNVYTVQVQLLDISSIYKCSAKNSIGDAKNKTWIFNSVTINQANPEITGPSTVTAGESNMWLCYLPRVYPAPQVDWTLNNVQILQGFVNTDPVTNSDGTYSRSSNLTLVNILADNNKYLRCEFTLGGQTYKSEKLLTVLDVPATVSPKPTVDVTTTLYSGVSGSVTLECRVSGATSITWYKGNSPITTPSSLYRGGDVSTPSLTIISVSSFFSDTYVCTASSSGGETRSTAIQFVFGAVPQVSIPSSTYTVGPNADITIPCDIVATPAVTAVEWRRTRNSVTTTIDVVGKPLEYEGSTAQNPSLKIKAAGTDDDGEYRCYARNDAGWSNSGPTRLTVSGNAPTVTVSRTSYSVTIGATVTLDCSVSGSPTNIFWRKIINGVWTDLTIDFINYGGSSLSTPSLTVYNTDSADEGSYACYASNSYGTGESLQIFLDISGSKPSFTLSKTSYTAAYGAGQVVLECSVTAEPAITSIIWKRTTTNGVESTIAIDNVKFGGGTVSSPSLIIYNVDAGDAGFYTCGAVNSIGTAESRSISLDVTGSLPTVSVFQSSYSVSTGTSLTLQCSVSGNPSVTNVYWEIRQSGTSRTINVDNINYGGSTVNSPSLVIYSADSADAGTYVCLATNAVGTAQSNLVSLTVSGDKPVLTISQSSYSVASGSSVTLQCSISGQPSPTNVYWQRIVNGVTSVITIDSVNFGGSSVSSPSLVVYNADSNDAGFYFCNAANSVGTSQSGQITLTVTGNIPTVTVNQASYSTSTGSTVTLQCSYTGNPTVTSVSWQKIVNGITSAVSVNGVDYTGSTVNNPSLTIYNVDSSDSATYRCFATNSVGTGQSSQVSLTVTGNVPSVSVAQSSYSVTTGTSVTLQCSVSGQPSVSSVYWRRTINGATSLVNVDNVNFGGSSVSSPSLIVYNADSNDAGVYSCYAVNSVGTGQSTQVSLSVSGNVPSVSVAQSSYSVTTGTSVTLQCSVSGQPSVSSVYWRRTINGATSLVNVDNVNFGGSSVNSPSLIVYNADSNDAGVYSCYAVNSVGTGQSTQVSLSVSGNVPSVSVAQSSYSVTTGTSVTLQCSVSGQPSVSSVYWRRTINGATSLVNVDNVNFGGSSVSSPSLIVYNADSNDAGVYFCYAVNSVGTGQSTQVSLSVSGNVPSVSVAQSSYSVTTGTSVTLQCSVSGQPSVSSVYWRRTINGATSLVNVDNVNFGGSSVNSPSLIVYNADSNDAGVYFCYAVNSVGTGQSTQVSLSVSGNVPSVSVAQSSYSVTTGTSVTLQCSVSGQPSVSSVYWQRTSNGVTSIVSIDNTNFGGSSVSSPSLIVYNADSNDAGVYFCYAVNSVGTGQSTQVSLSVTGNVPTVSVAQTSYSVTTGSSVTLQCSYSGSPSVTSVSWQRITNGIPSSFFINGVDYIGGTLNSPSLTFVSASSNDQGTYRCLATNSVGTGQSSLVSLSVTGNVPSVSVAQSSYSVTTGTSVTLQCSVSGQPSVSSVYWRRTINGATSLVNVDNVNFAGSTVSSPSLTVYNADSNDAGLYFCYAVNSVGTGQSSQVSLSVTGDVPTISVTKSDYSATTGDNVILQCSFSGTPAASSVTWIKNINGVNSTVIIDGTKYGDGSVSSPSLRIYNVEPSDSGTYLCSVTNSVGTAYGSFITLSVTGSVPTVTVAQTSYSITTGSSVTLQCSYSATPSVTSVSWQKITNGVPSTFFINGADYVGGSVNSPSLTFVSASSNDQGTYRCLATNSVGTGQSSLISLSVTGSIPVVSISQSTYSVTTGSSVTLQCSYSGNPQVTSVSWQRVTGSGSSGINIDGVNYGGSTTSSPSLTVYNADSNDEGSYRCLATNSVGTGQSNLVSLSVSGNVPVLTVAQTSYSITTGSTITLQCSYSGSPQVTGVSWQKLNSGVAVPLTIDNVNYGGSSVGSPSLIIYNSDSSDEGSYRCLATNSVGTGQSSLISLSVTGAKPIVNIAQSTYSISTGSDITLICSVTASPAASSVSWSKTVNSASSNIFIDGTKYTGSSVNSPSLVIKNADANDSGSYRCSATNSIGTTNSGFITLTVSGNIPTAVIPQISYSVTVGNRVTIPCSASANPSLTSISWTLTSGQVTTTVSVDGVSYSGATVSSPSLVITAAKTSDQGYYTCKATNAVGTADSNSAYLYVAGNIPTVVIRQSAYSVLTGNSVTLGCTITATPQASSVAWQRIINGVSISVETETSKYAGGTVNTPSLTITDAQSSDQGDYRCLATNNAGTGISALTFLSVTGNVPAVTISQNTFSVTTGSSITLGCSYTASPSANAVTWKKLSGGVTSTVVIDNSKFSGGSLNSPSLTITNSQKSDEGYYTCEATNAVGRGTSTQSYLSVTGSIPTVQIAQLTYSITTGQEVKLVCSASGIPAITTILWKRSATSGGNAITLGIDGSKYRGATVNDPSLTISNTAVSDVGYYTCTATNSLGTGSSSESYLLVSGSKPVVTVVQTTYSTFTGSSVTLQCSVAGNPAVSSVAWRRTIGGQTSTIVVDGVNFEGATVSQPYLTIKDVDANDAGTYICTATNAVGTTSSDQIVLSVSGNIPSVTVNRNSYSVITGQSITLQCSVTASPDHTAVSWQRTVSGSTSTVNIDGSLYTGASVNTPSLTIVSAKASDAGTYVCRATNVVGTGNSANVQLSVSGSIPTVTVAQSSYSITTGQKVTLDCTVSAIPGVTEVKWEKSLNGGTSTVTIDGTKTEGGSVGSPSLVINNAASSDIGFYTCSAKNIVGTGTSQQTYLTVTGSKPTVVVGQASYSVTKGSSVTLQCSVSATPTHTAVTWRRTAGGTTTTVSIDGTNYIGSAITNPSLTISKAGSGDGGTYVCTATNIVGTGESSQTVVTVTGDIPTVTIQRSNYTVTTGVSVTLVCTVTATPTYTSVFWQRIVNGQTTTISIDGVRYSGGSVNSPSLTISTPTSNDQGVYICSASNIVGTGQSGQTTLTVTGGLPNVAVPTSSLTVVLEESITIRCTIQATPPTTSVYWQKRSDGGSTSDVIIDGTRFTGSSTSNPSLTINNALNSDQGFYMCRATNAVGTGESTPVFLSITGTRPTVVIPDTTYTVVTGSDVIIPCDITASPSATVVSWKRTVNSVTKDVTIDGVKYNGGSVQTPSLTVKNTDNTDQGFYVCSATNIVGTGSSSQAYLTVTGSVPTVVIAKSSYSAVVGAQVMLECVITAAPAYSSVSWERTINGVTSVLTIDGTNFQGGSVQSPSLVIASASVDDQGNYVCTAGNSVGVGRSSQTFLTVTGNVPIVAVAQSSYSVTIGDSVTLGCSITSATPAATSVTWQKISGGTITDVSTTASKYNGSTLSSPSLTISAVELTDQAYYKCRATNAIGTGESSQTYLYVTGNVPTVVTTQASYTVSVGNRVMLDCTISATPSATSMYWEVTSNGQTSRVSTNNARYTGATMNSPSLIITNATSADQGAYVCKAVNQIGTGSSNQVVLYVSGGAPFVSVSSNPLGYLLGTLATLDCTVSGTPRVDRVFWQKVTGNNAVTLTGNKYNTQTADNANLIISNLEEADGGFYRCHAVNSIGETQSNLVTLTIYYAPRSITITPVTRQVIQENNAFTLTCNSDASPTASYSWKRNEVDVGSSAIYSVVTADRGHAGTYKCTATNNYGTLTATREVEIEFKPISNVVLADLTRVVTLGNSVTLNCLTLANPQVSAYQWQKNGVAIPLGPGQQYTIEYTVNVVSNSDYDTYSCIAANSLGQMTNAISFSVTDGSSGGGPPLNTGASTASSGLTSGEIAAIILAVLFILIIILLIIFCCIKYGVCGQVCCKKEKPKGRVVPEKPKEIIRTIEIPRYVEKPYVERSYVEKPYVEKRYVEKPYYFKSRAPSSTAISRQDVSIHEENFEISRYQVIPPSSTSMDGNNMVVSMQDGHYHSPRPHHLPALDYENVDEDVARRERRRRKKKKRRQQREREARERAAVESSPRREGDPIVIDSQYGDEVMASQPYYN